MTGHTGDRSAIHHYNRRAWDQNVAEGSPYTIPVEPAVIGSARRGVWEIRLTPNRAAPRSWFPPQVQGLDVLCLAGGGGQQGPVLAAAGARVTVCDNSPRQLAQDRLVAGREGLALATVQGNMSSPLPFPDGAFDLLVNPISNLFVPDLRPVWAEAYRVLHHGGTLLSGFMNPAFYLFDRELMDDQGLLQVRHALPYSDLSSLSAVELQRLQEAGWPLEFGHTLTEQFGGQLQAGFVLTGFYEDRDLACVLDDYLPVYLATRAEKR